jgi:hypothetical protein
MKQDFTQQQWEHLLLAQKEYTIAKATGDPSENDKLNALINAFAITEDYDQQDLEAKMAEFYGPNWKKTGGPLYTACQLICSIAYAVCDPLSGLPLSMTDCEGNYKNCLRMCGLLPEGL